MALVNFTANFSMLVSVFDRIAVALERMVGPEVVVLPQGKKRGPESIIQYGNEEREWAKENFRSAVHEQGFAPEREEKLVAVALKRYDYMKRRETPNEPDRED